MKDLYIKGEKGTYITPTVNFSLDSGLCEISGESFLEETSKFYSPLVDWIKNYITKFKKDIIFSLKLTYFNTSTSKWILNILNTLSEYERQDGKVIVNWYYYEDDIDMEDDIEDYHLDTGIQINKIIF